jgi:hypothetical protein
MMLLLPILCSLVIHYNTSYHVQAFASYSKTTRTTAAMTSIRSTPFVNTNTNLVIHHMTNDSNDDGNENSENDLFMSSLYNRIQTLQDQETKIPLIVLDAMVPRQKLELEIKNELLLNLITHRIKVNENPTLGMLGKAILSNGDVINLTKGVEVEISIKGDNSNASGNNNGEKSNGKNNIVEFKAGRRFRLDGQIENSEQGWTEGEITYLSSKEEEDDELKQNKGSMNPVSSIANAISKAKELTSPNLNLPDNVSLIERWIDLATENERQSGQIDKLVKELGDMPKEDEPTEMSFYIGSLINPIPAMGVAMEIRPALLMAESAEERIQIAHDAIVRSIKHMDGSARMW